MKSKSAEKIKLTSYDDLFGSSEVTAEEKIVSVPIRLFHTFKDHPFRVLDDEKMQETVESVKRYGILMRELYVRMVMVSMRWWQGTADGGRVNWQEWKRCQ